MTFAVCSRHSALYAQKPDATACAEIEFWNKYGRWVNRGTTGIALLVDTDQGYKLRHVFDMSDTNSQFPLLAEISWAFSAASWIMDSNFLATIYPSFSS